MCLTFSIELSGLDLPDITIGTAASTVKGLSRKRPRRSLNVTAFEKRLKDGNGKLKPLLIGFSGIFLKVLWMFIIVN